MIKRTPKYFFGFACLILLVGCGGAFDRVRPQALQPEDQDISKVQDNLVFLSVHIKQQKPSLKLRGLQARNRTTQELYTFPFFDNVIMKSKELQHTIRGDTVEHLVFLDLPVGTYEMTSMQFFNIYRAGKVKTLDHKVRHPVLFEVTNKGPTYLGRLDVNIVSQTVQSSQKNLYAHMHESELQAEQRRSTVGLAQAPFGDQFRKASYEALSAEIQTLGGLLVLKTSGPHQLDLARAKARYSALANQPIASGKLWLE